MQEIVIDFFAFSIQMPFEAIVDWPLGTVLGIFILACYAAILGLVCWGVFRAIDSWWQPLQDGIGIVRGKTFTPAHTVTNMVYNAVTKTSVPIITRHPNRWSVCVEVDGDTDSIDVTKDFYNFIAKDRRVPVVYVRGRLTGGLYLRDISRP